MSGNTSVKLRGEIAILMPYRSQFEQARLVLERTGTYVKNGISKKGFEIMVDCVDSMPGSEKDIIMFAPTRSKNDRKIGFLGQPNRLHVATPRAQKNANHHRRGHE